MKTGRSEYNRFQKLIRLMMKNTVLHLIPGSAACLAAMALFPVVTGCASRQENRAGDDTPGWSEDVDSVAEALAGHDAAALARVTVYPLERPYPLRDIEDSAAMVAYYPIMVDDSLRHVVAAADTSRWISAGWRGTTLDNGGYVWIDRGLYAVNYMSEAEKALRDILVRDEMESLAPELRDGWEPAFCVVDPHDGTLYRVDVSRGVSAGGSVAGVSDSSAAAGPEAVSEATDTVGDMDFIYPGDDPQAGTRIYRLMVYPRTFDLGGDPSVIMRGRLERDGTMDIRTYVFDDSEGSTAEYQYDRVSDDEPCEIVFRRHGSNRDERHPVTKAYWRDYHARRR